MDKIKIASEKNMCLHCFGAGFTEPQPYYYETCIWCNGSGKEKEEEKESESV